MVWLIASKRVLGHGIGCSGVGRHVVLLKISQTSLERAVTTLLALRSWASAQHDEPTLAPLYLRRWSPSGHACCLDTKPLGSTRVLSFCFNLNRALIG